MEDFISKLNNKDTNAFKYVFDTYYKSICLFVRKYISDPAQAEDIAQDVFVSIWEKQIKFTNPKAFKSYLYQTARNKSINALEHEAVKKDYQEKTIPNYTTEDFFHKNYIENESQRLIIKMLENLSPREREIIYLQLEGLKNNEIAEKLGISIYTVKNHKASAYKYIKKRYSKVIILSAFIALLIP